MGLVEVLAEHPQIIVVADEIYQHINFTGSFTSLGSFEHIADRTVVINGVSKAYAMTGWRIGFCAAPSAIAKAVTKLEPVHLRPLVDCPRRPPRPPMQAVRSVSRR